MLLKSKFWDENILLWEHRKYRKAFFDANLSVKHRLNIATTLLHQLAEGKRIVELACGSGRLWEKIKTLSFKSYTGVDFSTVAIKAFQSKVELLKKQSLPFPDVSLVCEDCTKDIYPADIVISLGLLDWLDKQQIQNLANKYKGLWFLHSFSEKQLSFSQAAHSVYSSIYYRQKGYFPRYRKAGELLDIFGKKAKIYRNSKALKFSAFVYHLPSHISLFNVPFKSKI